MKATYRSYILGIALSASLGLGLGCNSHSNEGKHEQREWDDFTLEEQESMEKVRDLDMKLKAMEEQATKRSRYPGR